jgi:hypothetical protein
VTMLAGGWTGSCAGTSAGVYCWGANNSYSLGVDAVTSATTAPPVLNAKPVIGASRPIALAMSEPPNGVIAAFASNTSSLCRWGAAGVTAAECFAISGGTAISSIASSGSGTNVCTRIANRVLCSGNNDYDQCGPIASSFIPPPGNDITGQYGDLSAGYLHACSIGIEAARTVRCWGTQFGDFNLATWAAPTTISAASLPSGVTPSQLSRGGMSAWHTCVIASDGSPWCFGRCVSGACGEGSSGQTLRSGLTAVLANW